VTSGSGEEYSVRQLIG